MAHNLQPNHPRYGRVPEFVQTLMKNSHIHMETLSQREYDIIESYKNDWDADDWGNAKNSDNPPLLGYQLIKWVGAKINGNRNRAHGIEVPPLRLPELLENLHQSHITSDDIVEQIKNAKILNRVLHGFPKVINENITVYRGVPSTSYYGNKALHMIPGNEMVIKTFCSTSINPTVAYRFTNANQDTACIWNIIIPIGQIFPYVSEDIPNEIIQNRLTGEQEILLPLCTRLRLLRSHDTRPRILVFELIGFLEDEEVEEVWKEEEAALKEAVQNKMKSQSKRRKTKKGGARKNRKTKKRTSLHIHMRRRRII